MGEYCCFNENGKVVRKEIGKKEVEEKIREYERRLWF